MHKTESSVTKCGADEDKSPAAIFARELAYRQARDAEEMERLYRRYIEDESRARSAEGQKNCGVVVKKSQADPAPTQGTTTATVLHQRPHNSTPTSSSGYLSQLTPFIHPMGGHHLVGAPSLSFSNYPSLVGGHPHYANDFVTALYGNHSHAAGFAAALGAPYTHPAHYQQRTRFMLAPPPQFLHNTTEFTNTQQTFQHAVLHNQQQSCHGSNATTHQQVPPSMNTRVFETNRFGPNHLVMEQTTATDDLPADVIQENDIDQIEPVRTLAQRWDG
uniref:Uncharacterized protein n=1 Tax=Globodera rostochiensis TaxID=31243 RepID=A0A914HSE6_GLORO